MMVDKSISNTISFLRLPLAILVVFIHGRLTLDGWSLVNVDIGSLCPADVFTFMCMSISGTISAIAVPLFFFISGYLFFANFQKWNTDVWLSKMKNRIHTLLIPYLLWSAFSFFMIMVGGILTHHGADNLIDFWNRNGGLRSLVWFMEERNGVNWLGDPVYVAFPVVVPLWFIRDLMVMVLLSPILYKLLKDKLSGGVILSLLGFAYVSGIFPFLHFVTIISVFMFSAGSWMALHSINWVAISCKYFRFFSILASALFVLLLVYAGNERIWCATMPWFVLSFGMTVISLASRITERGNVLTNLCKRYAHTTFFLYVFHCQVLSILTLVCDKILHVSGYLNVEFVNAHFLLAIFYYFARIAIAIVVSIAIFKFIDKYLPRLSKLMCGGK